MPVEEITNCPQRGLCLVAPMPVEEIHKAAGRGLTCHITPMPVEEISFWSERGLRHAGNHVNSRGNPKTAPAWLISGLVNSLGNSKTDPMWLNFRVLVEEISIWARRGLFSSADFQV